jgi:DNA-binding MarR family transcriptional regulator
MTRPAADPVPAHAGNGERTKQPPAASAADADIGAAAGAKPSDMVSSKVIRLANLLRRSATLVYGRKFGLSQVEWRIVALVGEHGPITLNALADLMGLDKGQISRGVSALVARHLLLREYRRNGRGIAITLGARGAELHREIMISAVERNRLLLDGMSSAEASELFKILDRLTGLARTVLAREHDVQRIPQMPDSP